MSRSAVHQRGYGLIAAIVALAAIGLVIGQLHLFFPAEENKPRVRISSDILQQGDTFFVSVKGYPEGNITGELAGAAMGFFRLDGGWAAIAGIDTRKSPGKYNLVVNLPGGEQFKREIEIIERKFPVTELFVSKELEDKGYTASGIVESITGRENTAIKEVIGGYVPQAYFSDSFVYPLEKNKIVGSFGNIRKSGSSAVQHLGADLEASVGTKVYAVNGGVVRFLRESSAYGKTMIIDHGLGIYSLYLHLDEFKAEKGQKVKRGDIVGHSGNTGYSIAPHLHFSIKISGSSIDPMRFIQTVQKEILSNFKN